MSQALERRGDSDGKGGRLERWSSRHPRWGKFVSGALKLAKDVGGPFAALLGPVGSAVVNGALALLQPLGIATARSSDAVLQRQAELASARARAGDIRTVGELYDAVTAKYELTGLRYASREQEDAIVSRLRGDGSLLLVTNVAGDAERVAGEAVHTAFPTREALVLNPADLGKVGEGDVPRGAVVWLPQVDTFVGAGLTQEFLAELRERDCVIIATVTPEAYDSLSSKQLQQIARLPCLALKVTEQDRARVNEESPERAAEADRWGMEAVLAAAEVHPRERQWADIHSPGVIAAAQDWREMGMLTGIPQAVLIDSPLAYGGLFPPNWWETADELRAKAATVVERLRSQRDGATPILQELERPGHYRLAPDVDRRFPHVVPRQMWEAGLRYAAGAEELTSLGKRADEAGVADIAERAWQQASRIDVPEAGQALVLLGDRYSSRDRAAAVTYYRRALDTGRPADVPGAQLGMAKLGVGSPTQQLHALAEVCRDGSADQQLEAHRQAARVLEVQQRPLEAVPHLDEVGRSASEVMERAEALIKSGDILESAGDIQQAARRFRMAAETSPGSLAAFSRLAALVERFGPPEQQRAFTSVSEHSSIQSAASQRFGEKAAQRARAPRRAYRRSITRLAGAIDSLPRRVAMDDPLRALGKDSRPPDQQPPGAARR